MYTDRTQPPPRDGLEDHQVWVWLWDTPRKRPEFNVAPDETTDQSGRWEVRGTGLLFDDERAMCGACGNIHPRVNHAACAANVAAGLHADGLDPETGEWRMPISNTWPKNPGTSSTELKR